MLVLKMHVGFEPAEGESQAATAANPSQGDKMVTADMSAAEELDRDEKDCSASAVKERSQGYCRKSGYSDQTPVTGLDIVLIPRVDVHNAGLVAALGRKSTDDVASFLETPRAMFAYVTANFDVE